MTKVPYFLMVACLAGGLAACGGGSSGGDPVDAGDGGDPVDAGDGGGPFDRDVDEVVQCVPSILDQSKSLISDEDSARWQGMVSTAYESSKTVANESLDGLWVIFSEADTCETSSAEGGLYEQDQVMNVFQINTTSNDNEIEIKDCSGGYWESGELINLTENGNSYDGTSGSFQMTETRVLPIANSNEEVSVTIVNNTELHVEGRDFAEPASSTALNFYGRLGNTVGYKVRSQTGASLGSINYKSDEYDILCAKLIQAGVESLTSASIVAQGIVLTADAVTDTGSGNAVSSRIRLSVSHSIDGQSTPQKEAFIGAGASDRESFMGDLVDLKLDADLSFSGSLGGSPVIFTGDIK